jgi:prevent-host-death family protein
MREVAVYEAKTRLSELLAEVEQGGQVTITRRGQPVARLVGVSSARRASTGQRQKVAATIDWLTAQRRTIALDGELKEAIAQGRD